MRSSRSSWTRRTARSANFRAGGILGVLIRDATPLRLHDIGDCPRSVGFPPNHSPIKGFLGGRIKLRGVSYGNRYLRARRGARGHDPAAAAPDGRFRVEAAAGESADEVLGTGFGRVERSARLRAEAARERPLTARRPRGGPGGRVRSRRRGARNGCGRRRRTCASSSSRRCRTCVASRSNSGRRRSTTSASSRRWSA
jgi:hypothetical protein